MQQIFQCYRCGAQNYIGQPSCWNCYSPFQWNCPNCRAPVQNTMLNCPYCRLILPWPTQQQNVHKQASEQPYYQQQTSSLSPQYQQQRRQTEKAPKEKRKNPWLIGILAVIVLIVIGGIINITNSNTTQVTKTTVLPLANTPDTSDTSDTPTINNTPNTIFSGTDMVYITRTGKKYHRADCGYLSESKIPIERAEAINNGYTPCSRCKP